MRRDWLEWLEQASHPTASPHTIKVLQIVPSLLHPRQSFLLFLICSAHGSLSSEVGLSGDGFLTFKMGFWNPRKRSSLTLAFLTYAPDGLLFYVGKDVSFFSKEILQLQVNTSLIYNAFTEAQRSSQNFINISFYVFKRDFMSLQLSSGLLKLSVDFGSGVASFSTENSYNDGKWHTVTLVREEKEVRLQVDEEVGFFFSSKFLSK